MNKIKNLTPGKKLEVLIIDENGECFFANKVFANHYDIHLNLLKENDRDIFVTEVCFEKCNDSDDFIFDTDEVLKLFENSENIELTIGMQNDNFNVDTFEICEITNEKMMLKLFISEVEIPKENSQKQKLSA